MSTRRRVLLIGWDAADWKVARPLIDRGEMPNLARLMSGGSSGNIGTLQPPLSPMLWTSIATGKRPPKHGIHGFSEPSPNGLGVQPISILSRTTKAVWNILNQNDLKNCVVGWWPSHPAEPINGVMVSNHFHNAGHGAKPTKVLPGAIHPMDWSDRLGDLRITPMQIPGEVIRLFVPEYDRIDQDKDKRVHALGKILAETLNLHSAATDVLENSEWDFAAVYYDSIDHFCHSFMSYHPPRPPWIEEGDFQFYQHVVNTAYRYHDHMLGRLLELAGPETTVIVMSDHGFHPDGLRRDYIPAEAAGPAAEHRAFGMLTINGEGIKAGNQIYGASLLDIAPTILNLFGLPVGRDMDGKVLVTAFEEPQKLESIASWDSVEGNAGMHPAGALVDPVASAEAMQQMIALGYIAPPGPDAAKNIAECLAELRYNLARAHDDAGHPEQSIPLYEALRLANPSDHRYLERLIGALSESGNSALARTNLDAFDEICNVSGPQADAEVTRRRQVKADSELEPGLNDEHQRELFERRRLSEQATGFVLLRQVLRLHLDLIDSKDSEARHDLDNLEKLFKNRMGAPALFLARSYARLGDDAHARIWIARALERDPDDWNAMGILARVHLRARRYGSAIDAAAASLALIYFQPLIHHILGRALAALGNLDGAERSFQVALAQMPGLVEVHDSLARLYKRQGRPSDAEFHRNRAGEMRRKAEPNSKPTQTGQTLSGVRNTPIHEHGGLRSAQPEHDIVIAAGLPRSGTSMLMQLLVAGGIPPLTDGQRAADSDNPRGYFEFEQATHLASDATWLPQARGKVVKLALPLLAHLPMGETYRVILIERQPRDVIASQRAMLARLGRTAEGTTLNDRALASEYIRQRDRLRVWLEQRPEVAVLPVQYEAILADPRSAAVRISAFLSRKFDVDAAIRAVEPALRRQNAVDEVQPS